MKINVEQQKGHSNDNFTTFSFTKSFRDENIFLQIWPQQLLTFVTTHFSVRVINSVMCYVSVSVTLSCL